LDVKNGSINTDSLYRIGGLPVLSIPGTGNVFVGKQNGLINTGSYNTFAGESAGASNSTGSLNAFFGSYAGAQNSNGTFNSFFGYSAGYSNNTGTNNCFFGYQSGIGTTSGSNNSFFGRTAGLSNSSGYSNVAIGRDALYSNSTGSNNVAIGDSALYSQTIHSANIGIGRYAGYSNTTGNLNVFIGDSTGYSTNQGANTFVGGLSGTANSSGNANTFIGAFSGKSNIVGSYNSFLGDLAGYKTTAGNANCFVGYLSGSINIDGGGLTMLGAQATPGFANLSNSTAIGANAIVSCNNCMALGGTTVTGFQTRVGINNTTPITDLHIIQQTDVAIDKVRGIRLQRSVNTNHWRTLIDPSNNYVFEYNDALFSYIEPVGGTFVSSSDERLKTDITSLPRVLDKLMLLQPKTYQYIATSDAGRLSYGFLAQDVEKLFPEFVFSGEGGIKGIAYSNFSVIAIKGIQEQQQLIEEQKQKIDRLEQQIEEVLKELSALRVKTN
jgi:hypothetical protein